jgi:hypothetical protein
MGAMPDETRTFESDAELARPLRPATATRKTSAKPRESKPASLKVEVPPAREIVLRLIELLKQV